MRSCHSTRRYSRRYWSGLELLGQKTTRDTESAEHSAYASFLQLLARRLKPPFFVNFWPLTEARGRVALDLKPTYPRAGHKEHAEFTLRDLRISSALSLSARFKFFFTRPDLLRPLFLGLGLLRDTSPRIRYALRAAPWQSGGCCKTRVRRHPKPRVAATNRSCRLPTSPCIAGSFIKSASPCHVSLPSVAGRRDNFYATYWISLSCTNTLQCRRSRHTDRSVRRIPPTVAVL